MANISIYILDTIAPFTIVMKWNQSRAPSTDDEQKKIRHKDTTELIRV